jgi:hypothetical protein
MNFKKIFYQSHYYCLFSSCTKEDVPAATVVNSKLFALSSVGTAGVSGTATVVEKAMLH